MSSTIASGRDPTSARSASITSYAVSTSNPSNSNVVRTSSQSSRSSSMTRTRGVRPIVEPPSSLTALPVLCRQAAGRR